jgi:hypothetical protein
MTLASATNKGRRIAENLCTYYHRAHKLVEARFTCTKPYSHPDEAPNFARLRFHKGTWHGDIEISQFAADELKALTSLASTLRDMGFDEQPALTVTIAALEEQPATAAPAPSSRRPSNDPAAREARAARSRANLGKFLGKKRDESAPVAEVSAESAGE